MAIFSRLSSKSRTSVAPREVGEPAGSPPPYTLSEAPRQRTNQAQAAQVAAASASEQGYYPPAHPPPQQQSSRPEFAPPSHPPPNASSQTDWARNNPFTQSSNSSPPIRRSGTLQTTATGSSIGSLSAATEMARRLSDPNRAKHHEDPLDFLRKFDTIFIIDDSGSMQVNERPDGSIGPSRWEEARDAVCGVVELASNYDDDGVDVYFLNSEKSLEGTRDANEVMDIFDSIEPSGATPTGTRLELLLLDYMDAIENYKEKKIGPEPKPRNYIIITDGSPTDDPESVIVAIAQRLDAGKFPLSQIGIQFIQVGDDEEAKEALQDLDDALTGQYKIRDMVDTLPYGSMALNTDQIVKALMGGVNKRIDRKKARTD